MLVQRWPQEPSDEPALLLAEVGRLGCLWFVTPNEEPLCVWQPCQRHVSTLKPPPDQSQAPEITLVTSVPPRPPRPSDRQPCKAHWPVFT